MRRRTNGAILFLVAALGVLGAHGDLDPSNGDAESSIPSESLGKPAPAPRPYPYPASAPAKKGSRGNAQWLREYRVLEGRRMPYQTS